MHEPVDILDIAGLRPPHEVTPVPPEAVRGVRGRAWLGIYFNCCGTYGRIYKDRNGQAYVGNCPNCRAAVRARIGASGTDQRMFETT